MTRCKRTAILFCLAGLLALLYRYDSAAQAELIPKPPGPTALIGGRVIVSPDAVPIDNAIVLIEGGRIKQVGPANRVTVPVGAKIIDCTGLVVAAGFQNSHVHFTEDKWADASAQPASKLTTQLRAMLTSYGFTTVVDTGSLLPNTVAIRRRIETHELEGPRILTAGLPLYPPAGIPFYVKDTVPAELVNLLPQPATTISAIAAVRADFNGGSDIIKLFTGSWITPGQVLPMPAAIADAAVAEAHRQGHLVWTHPSNVAGLEVALHARVDVLAHAIDDTRGLTPGYLKRMKDQDVALIPTLKLLANDGRREVLNQVRDYSRAGGRILFGTDVGYLPDYDPVREYELLETAGLTWRQILASLTTAPAAEFHESRRRGQLVAGMDGDVVVLGADPGSGPRAFSNVRYTIKAGRIIYQR